MAKTVKGTSVIDTLESGDIYIETGNDSTLITRIGKTSKAFSPYVESINNFLPVFYVYQIKKEDLPTDFSSTTEFISALRTQIEINEYVTNWVDIGAETLSKNVSSLINQKASDIVHLGINTGNGIFDRFFKKLTVYTEKRFGDIIYAKNELNIDDLSVAESAPEDIKEYLNNIFNQLHREDRSYTFDEVNLEPDMLSYVDGLVDLDYDKISKFEGKKVILVIDTFNNGEYIANASRLLEEHNIEILSVFALSKIFN